MGGGSSGVSEASLVQPGIQVPLAFPDGLWGREGKGGQRGGRKPDLRGSSSRAKARMLDQVPVSPSQQRESEDTGLMALVRIKESHAGESEYHVLGWCPVNMCWCVQA